jgi:transcriptional regulator with XRE-family HTH domain
MTAPLDARSRDLLAAFGRSSVRLRTAKGWTQTRLAREAGVGNSVLCRVEAGVRECLFTAAWRIAQALGTTVDAMIAEADLGAGEGR